MGVIVVSLTVACIKSPSQDVPAAPTDDVLAELLELGYAREDIEVQPGGEIKLRGKAVQVDSVGSTTNQFRQSFSTGGPINPDITTINIYLAERPRPDPAVVRAFHDAVARWNELGLRFDFNISTDPVAMMIKEEPWIMVHPAPCTPAESAACAELPSSGNITHELKVTPALWSCPGSTYPQTFITATLMHELGHALGFGHTDWENHESCEHNGTNPYTAPDKGVQDIAAVDGPDPASIMNACLRTSIPSAQWSIADEVAIEVLYGKEEEE